MRNSIAALLVIMIMLSAVPAHPHMKESMSIEIISDDGGTFFTIPYRDYRRGSTRVIKKYLEAIKGENYSVAVRNTTSGRIGVVIAVDGRNIIDGSKSKLESSEMMYLVNPYSRTKLEGWRTDSETVHRFHFIAMHDSYSVRTFVDSSALGIIAVAAFREKKEREPGELFERQAGKKKAGRAPSPAAESDAVGTGFGEGKYSPTVKVEFEPERRPFEKLLVKYEWRESLCRKGLLECRKAEPNRLWDGDGYAPYPPGYHE